MRASVDRTRLTAGYRATAERCQAQPARTKLVACLDLLVEYYASMSRRFGVAV
jgi:hypothetical protein